MWRILYAPQVYIGLHMANLSLSLVNQKLAYARAMLKKAAALGVSTTAAEKLQLQAMIDAAVFHLMCGFNHYLREVAETYQVKDVAMVNDCASLWAALGVIDKEPAEALELQLLAGDNSSWLGQLQRYYQGLWLAPKADQERRDKEEEQENLIAVKVIDASDDDQEVGLEVIQSWEVSFVAMIVRQRETSSEY